MNTLLIGPSSVGKSTLIEDGLLSRLLGRPLPSEVVFGKQLSDLETYPQHAVIHYNMLHPVFTYEEVPLSEVASSWDFYRDPGFSRLQDIGVADAVVVVAPINELITRIRSRDHFEADSPSDTRYRSDYWEEVVTQLNLFSIYESLFEILESSGIGYQVVLSSVEVEGGFRLTDRVLVHHHLRGIAATVPPVETVDAVLSHPGCQYQSVVLPRGVLTDKGSHLHIGGTRAETFDLVLGSNLLDKSVLDVGCAIGDLLFRAERLGADRLVGIELKPDRFDAAVAIGQVLQSSARFHLVDFREFEADHDFDHVFVLNVLHHVTDFWRILEKACQLTRETLTLEFPTLADPKFAKANCIDDPEMLATLRQMEDLPVVGVSSNRVDQSFVYTPVAIKRICMEEIGGFRDVRTMTSPLNGRVIMVFEK